MHAQHMESTMLWSLASIYRWIDYYYYLIFRYTDEGNGTIVAGVKAFKVDCQGVK